MVATIRISQKHVERFAFVVVVFVLLVLLVNEKYSSDSTGLSDITAKNIAELLPNDVLTEPEETTTTIPTTTTTTTSTTTTTAMSAELKVTVSNVKYEILDENKAKLKTFYVEVRNGLSHPVTLTLKYYIYDIESSSFERITPKKPYVELGTIKSNGILRKTVEVDKYLFNFDLEKTLKVEVVDEDGDITETIIVKVNVD